MFEQIPVHLVRLDPAADILDGKVYLIRMRATAAQLQLANVLQLHAGMVGLPGTYVACSPTGDVDDGTPPEVGLGLPQDLVGDRGGVSFSEQYVTDYVVGCGRFRLFSLPSLDAR